MQLPRAPSPMARVGDALLTVYCTLLAILELDSSGPACSGGRSEGEW